MGALLGALGLKLIVAVDEAALAKIRHRLVPSRWPAKRRAKQRHKLMEAAAAVEQNAHAHLFVSGKHRCAGDSDWGRRAQAAKMAGTTPEARQHQASRAATARWRAARRRLREAAADSSRLGMIADRE